MGALLEGKATPRQLDAVIRVAHALARSSLGKKHHLHALARHHGLSLSDLAYDCIAELFARDQDGCFFTLKSYFAAFELDRLGDDEFIAEFRHLVFSKVKQGILRLYREIDPQFGKILRNITLSVQASHYFEHVPRSGEPCLVPVACDNLEELPELEAGNIADYLRGAASGREFIPELLRKVTIFLKRQNEFSRVVPLVVLGQAIRQFYGQKCLVGVGEPVTEIDDTALDAQAVIALGCRQTKERLMPKFVRRDKVRGEVFELYFKVIERYLRGRFVEYEGEGLSLLGCLMTHMPALTIEQCRKEHKNRLEYLARVVGNFVSGELAA
jgi:hypothetical protein